MTPLNNLSKKLVPFIVLLSMLTAVVTVACDSGGTPATPTTVVNTNTGGEASPATGIITEAIPSDIPTAQSGSTSPGGVTTGVPALETTTPAPSTTGTPNSNTNN